MNLSKLVEQGGCSLPWLHTEINLQNNQTRPCCKYKQESGNAENFKSVWFDQSFSKLRQDIVNNNDHPACNACDVPANAFSYKKWKNELYSIRNLFDGLETESPALPKIFHFTLSNTCNLTCRMCFPESSSKLVEFSKKSAFLQDLYNYKSSKKLDIKSLAGSFANAVHLTISGGEPLIDEDCASLIEMVKEESSKIKSIAFSTNMTQLNIKLIDMLVDMNLKIYFNTSIDGPESIQEYIRYGSTWDKITKNLAYLKSRSDNFMFGINSTISALNAGYMPELLAALGALENQLGINFTHIMATPVLEDHLHPASLPESVKSLYADKLSNAIISSNLKDCQILVPTSLSLMSQTGNTELLVKFLKEFDRVAGTNYKDVYPEFDF